MMCVYDIRQEALARARARDSVLPRGREGAVGHYLYPPCRDQNGSRSWLQPVTSVMGLSPSGLTECMICSALIRFFFDRFHLFLFATADRQAGRQIDNRPSSCITIHHRLKPTYFPRFPLIFFF